MERQAPQQPNMADTDLLDAPIAEDEDKDELAPPVRPVRAIAPPVAPDIAPAPAAPPAMPPVAHGAGPNFGTAMDNTIGARPNPNAPQYQPIKPTLGQSILGRIAAGMVGYRNPQAGVAVRREQEQAPIRAAQQKYSTDVNDYNQKFGQELQLSNEEQNEPLRASEIAKNEATATKELAPVAAKNESPQQGYAQAIQDAITAGRNPADDPHVQAWKAAIDATQKQPNPNEEDKAISDYEQAHGEPDTPANRDKARVALKREEQPPERGTWMPIYGPGGVIAGSWNPATGEQKSAPGNLPGTTAAGVGEQNRETAAQEKQVAPHQTNLDEIAEAREFAASPSPTNDYGLLMDYIGLTKPESLGKLRLNSQELKLTLGTRSSLGDLEALGQKIANGQMLTPTQRHDMLKTLAIVEKYEKAAIQRAQGGKQQQAPATGGGGKVPSFKEWKNGQSTASPPG